MSPDPLLSPDPEELARFARVEPPPELDAWMRDRLRAAVAQQATRGSSTAALRMSQPAVSARDEPLGVAPEPRRSDPSRLTPARAAAVPFVERLALGVGAVACGVQASSLVIRMVWSALTLGR